jgi:hypothetical protein
MIPATLLAGYQVCTGPQLLLPPGPATRPPGGGATWPAHDTRHSASWLPGMKYLRISAYTY